MKIAPWRECQQPFNHKVTQDSQAHADSVYPNESVGFVVNDTYIPLENIHSDPLNHFEVDPKMVARYGKTLQAVIHSHPLENHPAFPSKADMITQMEWNVPFGIQLINASGPGNIIWFGDQLDVAEYEGRPYIYGVYDCWSIVRDYYRMELDAVLPVFPREDLFWERDEEMYLDNAMSTGFTQVELGDIQKYDIVLIQLRARVANHAILYLGGDKGLHHMPYKTSKFDTVSRYIDPKKALFNSVWRYDKYIKGTQDE